MKIAVLLVVFVGIINVQAATYEQTAWWNLTTTKQGFTFDQFNPQWGTLQSAQLTIGESDPSGYIQIITKVFTATIRDIRSKLQLTGTGIKSYESPQVSLLTSIKFNYLQVQNETVNYVILSGQRLMVVPYMTGVSSAVLADYVGLGSTPAFTANAWAYVSKTPEIYTVISTSSYYAPTRVTLTYNFLPAPVPESSTYGMALGVLALVYCRCRKWGTKKPCVAGLKAAGN